MTCKADTTTDDTRHLRIDDLIATVETAGLEVEREKKYFDFLKGSQFMMKELHRRFAPH